MEGRNSDGHTFYAKKNSYAGWPGLSLVISAQFTLKMCVTAENCKKNIKFPYFKGSRLFKVIDVDITKKPVIVLVMLSSIYISYTYLQPFSR